MILRFFWTAFILILGLSIAACSGRDESGRHAHSTPFGEYETVDDDQGGDDDTMTFPKDFIFGVATAGYQIEMGCPTLSEEVCGDRRSDWYQFATSPETVDSFLTFLSGQDPAVTGPGHWELYEEDLDLAADDLGLGGFRMSIEWSRIFPEPTFEVEGYENLKSIANADAIDHYHKVFAALRERGLTPLVNLNHYTLPDWVHDAVGCHTDFLHCSPRGWVDKQRTVAEIAKYAGFAAREFGGEVDLWATLNEPMALALPGYIIPTPTRTNPPVVLLQSGPFKTVLNAMIEGHARMVDSIRANDLVDADGDGIYALVGLVYAMSPVAPRNPSSAVDREGADNLFYLWNMAFLRAIALGQWDENLDGHPVQRADLADRLDFLGLNYYTRITADGLPFSIAPSLSPLMTVNPLTLRFDEIYPRGIFEMASIIQVELGVPLYITENNARSDPNDDASLEEKSMIEHLKWALYAIDKGIDIRGYFYWSLTDFIEWNQGVVPWGLYAVDPATKTRSPRALVDVYRRINRAHGIPDDLSSKYPIDFE